MHVVDPFRADAEIRRAVAESTARNRGGHHSNGRFRMHPGSRQWTAFRRTGLQSTPSTLMRGILQSLFCLVHLSSVDGRFALCLDTRNRAGHARREDGSKGSSGGIETVHYRHPKDPIRLDTLAVEITQPTRAAHSQAATRRSLSGKKLKHTFSHRITHVSISSWRIYGTTWSLCVRVVGRWPPRTSTGDETSVSTNLEHCRRSNASPVTAVQRRRMWLPSLFECKCWTMSSLTEVNSTVSIKPCALHRPLKSAFWASGLPCRSSDRCLFKAKQPWAKYTRSRYGPDVRSSSG